MGYIDTGDWMSYYGTPITIPTTGTYTVELRVASAVDGGIISFEESGGKTVYALPTVPNTSDWQNWTTLRFNVSLTAGTHRFGLGARAGGWNINWIKISQ